LISRIDWGFLWGQIRHFAFSAIDLSANAIVVAATEQKKVSLALAFLCFA
jgi:hypothetical protein